MHKNLSPLGAFDESLSMYVVGRYPKGTKLFSFSQAVSDKWFLVNLSKYIEKPSLLPILTCPSFAPAHRYSTTTDFVWRCCMGPTIHYHQSSASDSRFMCFFCVHLCGTHISSFFYYQLYLNGCKWLFVQALVTELSEKLLIRKFISLMSYSANRSPY